MKNTARSLALGAVYLIASFSVSLGIISPGYSQDSPQASEQTRKIEALVSKAAMQIERKGKSSFPEFRNKESEWWFGETYLFAYDTKLNVLLVAAFPKNEGQNKAGKTDAKGKRYHDEFVKTVQSKGAGWVNYMFPKPGQKEPSEKWSYVKAVNIDGVPGLVGAGFYPSQ